MENNSKKLLQSQYKEREAIGGAYLIRNTNNKKILVDATVDLKSIMNRFEFSMKTGSCVYMKLQGDWAKQGGGGFVFETLEELKKDEKQTEAGFKADVDLLREMWREKLSGEDLY